MTSLQARIQDDLAEAMRDRDMARVKVLRTTMSAIQNGEAVEGVASVEGVVGYSDVQRQAERADGLQRELEVLRSYLNPD
jgi:Yqey-like protein